MRQNNIGPNQTEIEYSNGTQIFFSYATPVAGWSSEVGWFRTTKKYSKTTSRHINKYFEAISEEFITELDPTAIRKLWLDSENLDK
jgi:hypothetical protein